MDGGGEGRCVGEVQGVEVLDPGAHGDAGHGDVNHLVNAAAAQNLDAQQLMGGLVGNQLGHEGGGIGIVVGLVVGDAGGGDHIVAGSGGLCLGQAGTACVQAFRQLDNAGSQAAAVGFFRAGQVPGQQPAGDVGGGAHGGPLALAGDAVVYLRAVAHGVDVVQVGSLVLVHDDGALEHLDAGIMQERGCGTDADGHDHHVSLETAHGRADAGGLLAAQHGLQAGAGHDPDALGLQLAADIVGDLGVEQVGHDLRSHVHHGDLQALGQEVFGDFQTDEAAAHNNGAAALVLVHISPQADGVVGGPHGEHTGQVDAGNIGNEGHGAGGDDQLIVGDHFAVCEGHGLGGSVNRHSLHPGLDLHTGQAHVLSGGVDDQLLPGLDAAAHIVGQAAAGIGNVLALGVNGDLGAAVPAHQLGSGLGTGGNAANDNNVHTRVSFMYDSLALRILCFSAVQVFFF